ncbi:hypothetical protein [Salinibius halmophilus]|uniref:hypothetical protein n=1 Tax=Salinibius halmophilus TaxID=1853216 RepID=UPI000E65ECC0|nr:hypothetical protein [Salinibius halmophilus]
MISDQAKLQAFLAVRIQAMAAAIDPSERKHDVDNQWQLQHADIVRQQLQHLSWLANYLASHPAPNIIDFAEQLTCDQEREALHALTPIKDDHSLQSWQEQFRVWLPPQGSEPELF